MPPDLTSLLETYNDGLRMMAGALNNVNESLGRFGRRLRAVEQRVEELERRLSELPPPPAAKPQPQMGEADAKLYEGLRLFVGTIVEQLCAHPAAAIVIALLIGLALAALGC